MSLALATWFKWIFCILIAGVVIYIIWDSWFKKKVNGKR
jgi:hypothetical protein